MATQIPPELTPAQAAALVTSGQKVYIGCCTSYARAIADALAAAVEYSILLAKVTKLIRTSAVLED